jgi:hypothetical protein
MSNHRSIPIVKKPATTSTTNSSTNSISQFYQPMSTNTTITQPISNAKSTLSNITVNPHNQQNKENNNYTNYEANIFNLLNNPNFNSNIITKTKQPVQTVGLNNNTNTVVNINEVKPVSNSNSGGSVTAMSLNLKSSRNNYQNNTTNQFNTSTQFNNTCSQFNTNNFPTKFKQQEEDEDDLEALTQKHERLIKVIISEEESYIDNHKKHVNEMIEVIHGVRLIYLTIGNECDQ